MKRRHLLLSAAAAVPGLRAAPAADGVTLAFVGDLKLDGAPGRAVRRGVDPFASFAGLLAGCDLRIANLECVVATGGRAEPGKLNTFRAHPRTLAVLRRHFDAVSVANNHSGDFGPAAFAEMLDRLERAGLPHFGGGRDLARAHAPLLLERRGLRIALLGYNEFFPRTFEADHDRPGVAWSEDEQVRWDIAQARSVHGADLVIPFMHWGWEYEPRASERQRRLARLMIDAGADAVVGGHPHVVQDTDSHRGRPIVYSLGNFVFDGFKEEATTTGWLLRLDVGRGGVRRWQTFVARLDREGLPHPDRRAPGLCWTPTQDAGTPCAGKAPS